MKRARGLRIALILFVVTAAGCDWFHGTFRVSSDPGAYPPTPPPWDGHVDPPTNPVTAPPPAGKK